MITGVQRPRLSLIPNDIADDTRGEKVVKLAQACGVSLDDWQEFWLRTNCATNQEGKFAGLFSTLIVGRQQGKSELLAWRIIGGLFLFGEKEILFSAHEVATANAIFRRVEEIIRNNTFLVKKLKGYKGDPQGDISGLTRGNGAVSVVLQNGNACYFVARTRRGSRGRSASVILLDEALTLTDVELGTILPVISSHTVKGDPQLILASSAPFHYSESLHTFRRNALEGSPARTLFMEWSAPEDAATDDWESIAQANPALNIRLSQEFVEQERETMSEEEFRRERMSIPEFPLEALEKAFIPWETWTKAADKHRIELLKRQEPTEPFVKFALAVDVPPSMDSATVSAVGYDSEGILHARIVGKKEGLDWVAPFIAEIKSQMKPVAVVLDISSAASALLPDFKNHKILTMPISQRDYAASCANFFMSLMSKEIKHDDQEPLNEAVQSATQKFINDKSWRWARADVTRDISPLVAVTLALHGLNKRVSKRKVMNANNTGNKTGGRKVMFA